MSLTYSERGEYLDAKLVEAVTIADLNRLWDMAAPGDVAVLVDCRQARSFPPSREIQLFAMWAKPVPRSRMAFIGGKNPAIFGTVRMLASLCYSDNFCNVFIQESDATYWLEAAGAVH